MSQRCKVCGSELTAHFPKVLDPITGETFAIEKCSGCGLGYTVPQPENLDRYYGEIYYGNRHSFTSKFCIKRRLKFVASVTKKEPGQRLLDLGCGDGSFLLAAKEAGWDVTGVEINPDAARAAGLDVREQIEQLPDGASFDCITLWHSLEHMPDIKASLSQLSQRLKPNGKLLIAVPDNGGFQSRVFGSKWIPLDVPRHLHHFDAKSLSFCLKQGGFTIQRQWHQELEYDLMGWSQSALNGFLSVPNVFLDLLAGKRRSVGAFSKLLHFVLGSILTLLALPVVVIESSLGRGGTIIVASGRADG